MPFSDLEYIIHQDVENLATRNVVKAVTGGKELAYPTTRTFLRNSSDPAELRGFHAILGTPNGTNVAYLVADHFHDIGMKSVERINVCWPRGQSGLRTLMLSFELS